jgi:hypothetical protein
VLDHLLADRALKGEVELLEGLSGGEAGRLDAALPAVGLARGDLGGEHRLQEPLVRPGLLAGALGEPSHRARGLVAGSDYTFASRGMHRLKGVPDEWELLAVA